MPGNWLIKKLGDFVTLQRGHDLPNERRVAGEVPVIGSFGITGWHNEARSRGPGVTVGRSGASFGVVSYSPIDFWPLNTALYVIDFHGNDPKFSYYFLQTFDFVKFNSGSAQPSLNRNFIHPVEVCVPPPAEQVAIAGLLGSLDDKIELNRRMAETLEAIARALFKSWFVDFDPVHAKAEGRPTGLVDDFAALFPDGFREDGVPEGWSPQTLAALADLNPESWTRANYPPHINYVDLANTKWGTIESVESHTKASAPSRAQRVLRPDDTIIGTVRPGNGSHALILDDGLTGSTGFAVLRPRKPQFREIVYLASTETENIERLANLADGGAYPAIRPHVVMETEITGFSARTADAFCAIVAPKLDRIAANRRESATLAVLRDTLLPKLISGELRIADAEQRIVAA